jgi:Concanavalin A-like lectin/glucanases superfamily
VKLPKFFVLCFAGLLDLIVAAVHGEPRTALDFDGVNARVVIPQFAANLPSEEITIEFWQKASAVRVQASVALQPYDFKHVLRVLAPYNDGMVYWDFGNNHAGGQLSYRPPVLIIGTWQHFACVASLSGNYMRIYRNGILEAEKTGMISLVPVDYDLMLGGTPSEPFVGSLAEFRIWNVARSQAEIQANMHQNLAAQNGLVACWHLGEGAGLIAYDSSGNGYTGTLANGLVWVPSTLSRPRPRSLLTVTIIAVWLFGIASIGLLFYRLHRGAGRRAAQASSSIDVTRA